VCCKPIVKLTEKTDDGWKFIQQKWNIDAAEWVDDDDGVTDENIGLAIDTTFTAAVDQIVVLNAVMGEDDDPDTDDKRVWVIGPNLCVFSARLLTYESATKDFTWVQVDSEGNAVDGGLSSESTGTNAFTTDDTVGYPVGDDGVGLIVLMQPVAKPDSSSIDYVFSPIVGSFLARLLTQPDSVVASYTWEEVYSDGSTLDGGRTSESEVAAIEANGTLGLPVGAAGTGLIVIIRPTIYSDGTLKYPFVAVQGFFAEITGAGSPGAGTYSWKKKAGNGTGSLVDASPAFTGSENAKEANGRIGIVTGSIVWLTQIGGNHYIFIDDSAKAGSVKTTGIGYTPASHDTAADTNTWDRADQGSTFGARLTLQVGDSGPYDYLRQLTFDADGHTVLVERETRINPSRCFPVLVTKTGGVAGDYSTTCSWVYTVKDLRNNELGTGVSPKTKRIPTCAYNAPSDNSPGLAYWDDSATLQLYHVAEEFPTTDTFDVPVSITVSGTTITFVTRKVRVLAVKSTSDSETAATGTTC
jgi:hypothetical protein